MNKRNKVWSNIKSFRFNSMFVRMFLLIFTMFSIPFFILSGLYYRNVTRITKEEIMIENNARLYGVRDISDTILSYCDRMCAYISTNDTVQMFMVNDWFTGLDSQSQKELTQLVKMLPLVYQYMDSVYVYSEFNESVYYGQRIMPLDELKDLSWMEEYKALDGLAGSTIPRLKNDNYPRLATIVKPVGMGSEKNGAVIMNINSDKMLNIITTENYSNQGSIYLVNDRGQVIMSSEEELFGRSAGDIPFLKEALDCGQTGTVLGSVDGMESVISVLPSDRFGFTYVSVTSMQQYVEKLDQLKLQIVVLVVVLALLSLALAYLAAVQSYRPISEIISVLEEPERFQAAGERGQASLNEQRYIISSILKQTQTNETMKDELDSKLKLLNQSQFVMLQSQINPHFLYNTLETINWMAFDLTGGDNRVSQAVTCLARMFRNNVYLGDYIIPIDQEIANTENYLDILKLRYEELFSVKWDIQEEIRQYSIIKICLQPIIENAVDHGLKPKGGDGLITIRGTRETDGTVVFTVTDNGVGMPGEQVEDINRQLNDSRSQMEEHIGIYNVNQRIKIVFGQEYGLTVEAAQNEGTTVRIVIPMVDIV